MRIELKLEGVKFYILVNENSFDAYRLGQNNLETSKKFGEETEKSLGYFTSLGKAVDMIIKSAQSTLEETVSLKQYVEHYKTAYEHLMKLAS